MITIDAAKDDSRRKTCRECGELFRDTGRGVFCGDECRQVRVARRQKSNSHRASVRFCKTRERIARKLGVKIQDVDDASVVLKIAEIDARKRSRMERKMLLQNRPDPICLVCKKRFQRNKNRRLCSEKCVKRRIEIKQIARNHSEAGRRYRKEYYSRPEVKERVLAWQRSEKGKAFIRAAGQRCRNKKREGLENE